MRLRNSILPPFGCCVTLALLFSGVAGATWLISGTAVRQTASQWKLSWHDEFNQPDGSRPDRTKWTYDLGGGGWGNQELESYTDHTENAHIEKGSLVITARPEHFTGSDGISREYTSARLKTLGLLSQKYGRFEARIKIPAGQGMWPAFWMMGDDIERVDWPRCGEIDIMENVGREPGVVLGSLHGPERGSLPKDLMQAFALPAEQHFSADFHLYAIEWQPDAIRFYVDDSLYATFDPRTADGGPWVFDHPFFILLNVAVGGDWPGAPDATTLFPQSMLVDYVRVYTAR